MCPRIIACASDWSTHRRRCSATGDYQPSGDPLPPSPIEKASLALATGTSGAKPPQRPALKRSPSVFRDLTNFRWLREPTSSLKMIAFIYGSWLLHRFALPDRHNPLDRLVHIQYPLKVDINDGGVQRYGKGWDDYYFLGFHVVVMAFIRQASVEWLLRPFAPKLGIKSSVKVDRFTEQGYSIMYWGTMSAIGIVRLRAPNCVDRAVRHARPADVVVQDRAVLARLPALACVDRRLARLTRQG